MKQTISKQDKTIQLLEQQCDEYKSYISRLTEEINAYKQILEAMHIEYKLELKTAKITVTSSCYRDIFPSPISFEQPGTIQEINTREVHIKELHSIDLYPLSIRAKNYLKRAGIYSVEELLEKVQSLKEMLKIRNIGSKTATEIIDILEQYGFNMSQFRL